MIWISNDIILSTVSVSLRMLSTRNTCTSRQDSSSASFWSTWFCEEIPIVGYGSLDSRACWSQVNYGETSSLSIPLPSFPVASARKIHDFLEDSRRPFILKVQFFGCAISCARYQNNTNVHDKFGDVDIDSRNSSWISDLHVSPIDFGALFTCISRFGFAYRIRGRSPFAKCLYRLYK